MAAARCQHRRALRMRTQQVHRRAELAETWRSCRLMARFSRLQTVLLVMVMVEPGNKRLSWRKRAVQVSHYIRASTGVYPS